MAATATQPVLKVKLAYPQIAYIALAVMAVIHILPKSKDDSTMRLLYTAVYFAAAGMLVWSINEPRAKSMKEEFAWKYAEAGPALRESSRLYLSSLNRFCKIVSMVLLVFIAANAISVLSQWMPALAIVSPLATLGWWASLAAILTFPKWGRSYLSEVLQRRRMLAESVETSDFKPRTVDDLKAESERFARPAVESCKDDHAFMAGGFRWEWRDFYKNCIVFGMTGGGKTVCLLNALLEGLLMSTPGDTAKCAGLIFDPKGDFKDKIKLLCGKYGRRDDVVSINPSALRESIHWNPLDSDDDELEVAARFAAALESLGMKAGNDTFWIDSAKKFIRHAIKLLRITNPAGRPPSFAQIGEVAGSLKRLSEVADRIADDDPRGDQCLSFFADEWATLADQTRGSIQAYITNMIDPFLLEPYATLFSGRSTMRIADMVDEGKILCVYMPVADKEAMSKVVCTFVKLEYYREILKRPDKKRSSFFMCDEFQVYFTTMPGKGDSDFFERSRQSNHANIIATQNRPALVKAATDRESVVNNLLGNCAVKIFLRNTDNETNEYASKIFGQTLVAMASSSLSQGSGKQIGSSGASANRQYDQIVRSEEFIGLAVPGGDVDYADTIVHLASRAAVSKEKLRWKVHPLKE